LLLNQYYYPDIAPTGRYLHDLARDLAARGHEVHVVASRSLYGGGGHASSGDIEDAVHIHRVGRPGLRRRSRLGRIADYLAFIVLATWRALRLPRPDLVLALTSPPYLGLVGKAVARLRGARHAHWIMDLYPDAVAAHGLLDSGARVFRCLAALTRLQLRGARPVIALGPFAAERVARYTASQAPIPLPLWAAPPLFDAPETSRARAARGWQPGELVLMYSGNMGLGHRFEEFLAAAARLGRTGPRWAFVGDGARRPEIEAFQRAHPEARLELHGYVTDEHLATSLASADVQLVSLRRGWEGVVVPSKIQAVLAVGRPVIFVGPPGNEVASWVEQAGAGWLVAEDDVEGLLGAVTEAGDARARERRGAAGRAFARTRFSREENCGRLVSCLEQAAQA
jgi:glycosyltransferase involved in cell wall biosynthesis